MEEKKIKLPKKYGLFNLRSFSNRNKSAKESVKSSNNSMSKHSNNHIVNDNDNKITSITTATDSIFDTNKKSYKSPPNIIYKKNISRPKGKINISKNRVINSSKKKISANTKFQNILSPIFKINNEEMNIVNNSNNFLYNTNISNNYSNNNILSYNKIFTKIHGNKEIQDKIKCHTIKNTNNIKMVSNIFNKNNTNSIKNIKTKIITKNITKNIYKNNEFINIEDLMLLEEKFNDVLKAINIKSNISNECFEFINFHNQSSFFNKFENYYKNINAKIVVHNSIILIIYNIILLYHLSFNNQCIDACYNYLINIIKMNHNSYLIICDYISNKVSSKEKENIWVKKLKIMINENLKHLDLNNTEYINYLMSKNIDINNDLNDSNILFPLFELKFYTHTIEIYLKIILKYIEEKNIQAEFLEIFDNLKYISIETLNNFFFTKILKIINKNASVEGGADRYGCTKGTWNTEENVPYINNPCSKKFTLILDLDETLISFKMDSKQVNKGVLKFRPGLDEFLQEMKKIYEIIVFTSATKQYADPIENEIENNVKYFDFRFYRQHAIVYDNYFVKDLSRIGRSLDKVIIVDNMPRNYKLQKENGIMIKPYWGEDEYDTALISLGEILKKIACNFSDVREGILFYKDDILNKVSSNFAKTHK